jgi:putative ABC transport system substrate-binding protein
MIVGVLAVVLAAGLHADRTTTPPLRTIAWIGYWTPQTDLAFRSFMPVFERRFPPGRHQLSVEYVHGSPGDAVDLERAIRGALARHPAIVVTPTGTTAAVARRVGGPTPVVFSSFDDPVRAGIVDSMRASSAPITGISLFDRLDDKRLEILHQAFPGARRVAMLADRTWAAEVDVPHIVAYAAEHQHLDVAVLFAEKPADVDALMSAPSAARYDAWYFPITFVSVESEAVILRHLRRLDKPAMHARAVTVRNGGLMSYEQDSRFVYDQLVDLIDRIEAGEYAGDIPVQPPRSVVLAVRTDDAGPATRIDPAVVRRADRVY